MYVFGFILMNFNYIVSYSTAVEDLDQGKLITRFKNVKL